MEIKTIKATAYMNQEYMDMTRKHIDKAGFDPGHLYFNHALKKGRTRNGGKSYVAKDAIEITFTKDECDEIYKLRKKKHSFSGETIQTVDVLQYAYQKGLITETQQLLSDWLSHPYINLYELNKLTNKWKQEINTDKEKIIVWDYADFVALPDSEAQKKMEEKRKTNKIMKMCVGENLKHLAKQDDIDLLFEDNNAGVTCVYFANDKSFNKIVVPAIQKYITELVNELGGNVAFKERRPDIHITSESCIFKLTDIKAKEE